MKINIPGVEVKSAAENSERLTMVLWGIAGCGKTTLAATAPGRKLIVNFDPDGPSSVVNRDDVQVLDLSNQPASIVNYAKGADKEPFGLNAEAAEEFDTLIVDSITSFSYKALQNAISSGFVKGGSTSLERPGIEGYTYRSSVTMQMIMNCLQFTGKYKKNCIFIAHEAAPETNSDGAAIRYGLEMGGSAQAQVPNRISEIWYVFDAGMGKERSILIRPARMRSPMKTRMFDTMSGVEFPWHFNPTTLQGETIEKWFNTWRETGTKLPLPTVAASKK